MRPLWIPEREFMFRVRFVRDMHATLCANHPGYRRFAAEPCPAAPPVPGGVPAGVPGGVPAGVPE